VSPFSVLPGRLADDRRLPWLDKPQKQVDYISNMCDR
jgi:hypothetical protein